MECHYVLSSGSALKKHLELKGRHIANPIIS